MSGNRSGTAFVRLIIYSMMGLVFFCLGLMLLTTNAFSDRIPPPPMRNYIGIVLMLWGIFRVFIQYSRYRRSLLEEEEDERDGNNS